MLLGLGRDPKIEPKPEDSDSAFGSDEDFDSDEYLNRPSALKDELEDVDRCVKCSWEVNEGVCEGCGTKHLLREEDDDADAEDDDSQPEDDEPEDDEPEDDDSQSEDDMSEGSRGPGDSLLKEIAYDSDREPARRGNTPLRSITPVRRPIAGYTHKEYSALLQRGATRLMIVTFNLEFSNERGIFAWADHDLYAEFAGPKMCKGDFWKIQLGRRFELDEDDYDGSQFIEGLLEETILYPSSKDAWDLGDSNTHANSNSNKHNTNIDSDNERPVLHRPGYDTTEDDLLDGESIASDVMERLENPAVVLQVSGIDADYKDETEAEEMEGGKEGKLQDRPKEDEEAGVQVGPKEGSEKPEAKSGEEKDAIIGEGGNGSSTPKNTEASFFSVLSEENLGTVKADRDFEPCNSSESSSSSSNFDETDFTSGNEAVISRALDYSWYQGYLEE